MKTKEKEVSPTDKKRTHKFRHGARYRDLAKQIEEIRPNKEIIFNTLLGIFQDGYADGYEDNTSDRRFFKNKQESRRKMSWDTAFNNIDDLIHKPKL